MKADVAQMAQGNVFFGWDNGKKWPLNWSTQAGFEYTYRGVGSIIDLVGVTSSLSSWCAKR
jgi:hypothetical protein